MIKKKLILLFSLLLGISAMAAGRIPKAEGASAYKTFSLDRNGELQETNEAYEAIRMIRTLSDDSTLDGAKDMFIDQDDYIYIADTNNKRIVVLDPTYEVIASFGSDILIKPMGVAVVDDLIYVADYGMALTNDDIGAVYVFEIDKEETNPDLMITIKNTFQTPQSELLEAEGFLFRPSKIAVDHNKTMYVINEGTTNGVIMINDQNRFINYFASNPIQITIWERLKRLVYQNNPNVVLPKNVPVPVTNVALDNHGYYYTITKTVVDDNQGDNLKKVNIGGLNFFPDDMFTHGNIVDAWVGTVGNLYAVTSGGTILEYDSLGNLLFQFGGQGTGNDKLGLFMSTSTIAQDSKGKLYVIDDNANRNTIQIFRETPFATQVHDALDLYNQAKYVESIAVWNEVLRYNSMFDMAYRGIGLGYLMSEDFSEALEYFKIAGDKENYSEAFWEIRNIWLIDNIDVIFLVIILVGIVVFVINRTNRKYAYLNVVKTPFKRFFSMKVPREFIFMFSFIKHPFDTCYEIKRKNRVSVLTGFLFLFALIALYIISLVGIGFIFNPVVIEEISLFNQVMNILLPVVIFVVANYLISSLMEGEGTFKATFLNTLGAFAPVFIIFPVVIIISNVLTLNEAFLVNFGTIIALGWSLALVYFNIKETHNYTVGQTFVNLFLTLLMMIVIIITLIMVYLMVFQVGNFVTDILKEVIIRE